MSREWSGLETNSELRLQEYEFREPESGAGWKQTPNSEYKSMSSENQRVERAGDDSELRVQEYMN